MFPLRTFKKVALAVIVSLLVHSTAKAQINAAARYEIDAKRIDVALDDKDALPRSREFIRLDSTYYVGWMYEGFYKYNRSADYIGYKQAIIPLHKAFRLMEKDYRKSLKKVYTSFMDYTLNQEKYNDFLRLSIVLEQCYNSIEMPDSVISLLERVESYHFQKDFLVIYGEKAWTYHRNRFFTPEKYDFLGNSVEENEKLAFKYCYKQLKLIKKNKKVNDLWYGPNQSEGDKLSTYHYLAMLHNYNQNYDSSEFYYQKLIDGNRVSWGNYAGLQHELGNIKSSIEYYQKPNKSRENALRESAYFLPTLYIYGGKTKQAIAETQQQILRSGSTPGFGWYNIALARSYLYDGQLDSAEFYLTKAANFKELHINTTLTQSQYEFTINLLKVQLIDKKMDAVTFLNSGWWHSPIDWYSLAALKIEKTLTQYVVVNQMANNPERKRIVYDLFCGESTISFDETLYLIKDFSTSFFIKKYNDYLLIDKRPKVHRYFSLLLAQFNLKNNPKESAVIGRKLLSEAFAENISDSAAVDTTNEKLFLARLYQTLANAHQDDEDKSIYNDFRNKFYEEYPQLVPFSSIKIPMKLTVLGDADETTINIVEDLKSCNIDWQPLSGPNTFEAAINFTKKGKMYEAIINVNNGVGDKLIVSQHLIFKSAKGTGKELALRLFGKGGAGVFEPEADKAANVLAKAK